MSFTLETQERKCEMANEKTNKGENPALAANRPDAADFVNLWQRTFGDRDYDLAGDEKAKFDLVEGVTEMAKFGATHGKSANVSVATNADGVTRLTVDFTPKAE